MSKLPRPGLALLKYIRCWRDGASGEAIGSLSANFRETLCRARGYLERVGASLNPSRHLLEQKSS